MSGPVTERVRSLSGAAAVICGDIAITVAAVIGAGHASSAEAVGILSGAFTAMSTMTTAYFGIKGISNTAQKSHNPT